jgi:hypothetical protein
MADKKISALTGATTPLAGTEVLPIVQSGATVKVAVSDLTAGRAVTALSLTAGTTPVYDVTFAIAGAAGFPKQAAGPSKPMAFDHEQVAYGQMRVMSNNTGTNTLNYQLFDWNQSGDCGFSVGNLIPRTAAKGINFTANTPAAGMTSQLLNWYEEGIWTPNQGSGLTVIGAFSSTGKYTRVGRNLTISGTVTGATSVALAAAGIITTNLPFTVGTAGHGNVTNAALTSFAAIICTSTNVTSAGAIAATGTLTFSATYFV